MGSRRKIFALALVAFFLTALFTVEATNAQTSSLTPIPTPTTTSRLLWQFSPANTTNPANKYEAIQWSSATVFDGVVYVGMSGTHSYNVTRTVQTDTIPQYTDFAEIMYEGWGGVYALNASTGKQIWSYIGDDCKATPIVAEGRVYAQTGHDQLSALNISNGQNLWTFSADKGVGSSPTYVDGKIYVGLLHGNVYSLYASSGFGRWNFTADPSHLFSPLYDIGNDVSTPVVVNGTVYVSSFNGNLYALSADNGSKLWSYDAKSPISLSPAVFNGRVYFGSGDGNFYALNTTIGEKIWNYTIGTLWSSFTVDRDAVFVNSGWWTKGSSSVLNNVFALNALNGDKLWNSIVGTASQVTGFGGSLTVIDDLVYLSSSDNSLYSINASTGAKISVFLSEGVIFSCPLVVNDVIMFFSSKDGVIYAYTLPYIPPSLPRPTSTIIQIGEPLIIGAVVLAVFIFVSLLFYRKHQKTSKLR